MEHKVVICRCVNSETLYCKNWDGKGETYKVEEKLRDCKLKPESCGYAVETKPSPPLKAEGVK